MVHIISMQWSRAPPAPRAPRVPPRRQGRPSAAVALGNACPDSLLACAYKFTGVDLRGPSPCPRVWWFDWWLAWQRSRVCLRGKCKKTRSVDVLQISQECRKLAPALFCSFLQSPVHSGSRMDHQAFENCCWEQSHLSLSSSNGFSITIIHGSHF